jgi:DNA-binding SARP family transcriptional activator
VDFAVLGPLRCTVGTDEVTPQRRREATLLCALLLDSGASMPSETLAAAVWAGSPPAGWPKALQMHVLRLRETIGRSQIETTSSGYRSTASPESIDVRVFETTVPALLAAESPLSANAATRLAELLGLWRGEPFEELGEWPPAVHARHRLGELRAAALDALSASRVARGVASTAELTDLVNEDPLREQRWAFLMLALYHEGRQTEALQVFQRARKTLTVEFGLEPGPELVALERAILDHDPRLDASNNPLGGFDRLSALDRHLRARELFDAGDRRGAIEMLKEAIADARARRGDPTSIGEATIDLADYARSIGDWSTANAYIGEAVHVARALDDPVMLARAALVAAGDGWVVSLDPVSSPIALLRDALARLPKAPTPLRARLYARLAVAESHTQPIPVVAADAEEAWRLASMLDDQASRAIALHSRIVADPDIAHLEARRELCVKLLALADAAAEPRWRAWALPALARIDAMLGDFVLADEHFAALEDLAETHDDPVARYHASLREVLRTTLRGDYSSAIEALGVERDAAVAALPDSAAAGLAYFGSLGIIQLLQGAVPDLAAIGPMETSFPMPTMDAAFRSWFAVLAAKSGDLEQAVTLIKHLDADALASLPRDPYWPSLVWLLSLAFNALADGDRANALYELALPYADIMIVDLGATFLGAMSHHLGVLASTFRAKKAAVDHFKSAIAAQTRAGADGWAAKSAAALDELDVSRAR